VDALEQILDQFHSWLEYKKLMVEDCRYETTLIRRSNQHQHGAATIQKQNQQCSFPIYCSMGNESSG